jgi:hypothetical protein
VTGGRQQPILKTKLKFPSAGCCTPDVLPPQNKNNGADWLAKLHTTHEMSAKEFSGDGKNEGRAGPAG